jgi:glycosyltransferase involved in cell wall biosynthesis
MSETEISLIMPAYNEEKRILPVLNNYYNHFKNYFRENFEIIVVPNNCTDRTLEVVSLFAEKKPNIRILNIPYYVGKGGAVMRGFAVAKGNHIGFVDADEATHPVEFLKLYNNIPGFHGVIASRKIRGAVIYPKRTLMQNLSSFIFNMKTRFLFGLKYKDTQCGAKLFKKDVAKFLTRNYSENGWIFDVNLLYLCKKNKIRILEHPIFWSDHIQYSKLTFFEGIKSVFDLLKYRLRTL